MSRANGLPDWFELRLNARPRPTTTVAQYLNLLAADLDRPALILATAIDHGLDVVDAAAGAVAAKWARQPYWARVGAVTAKAERRA